MAKAKLIFDLTDPEDLREYNLVNKAIKMDNALFEIRNNLRRSFRHNDTIDWNTSDLIFEEIEKIMTENQI